MRCTGIQYRSIIRGKLSEQSDSVCIRKETEFTFPRLPSSLHATTPRAGHGMFHCVLGKVCVPASQLSALEMHLN